MHTLKTIAGVALLTLAYAASGSAQITYTVRIEAQQSGGAASPDPMMAMMGTVMLEHVAPDGSLEMTYQVGQGGGVRVEWNKVLPGIPAGAALLRKADGATVMLNPADRTYWRLTLLNIAALPGWKPEIVRSPGPDSATLQGAKVAQTSLRITIPFPLARTGELVSGMPTELQMAGDIWLTDRFKPYVTPATAPVLGLATLGLGTVTDGGFMLRQILRGPMLGAQQLESRVTSLVEGPLPEGVLEIPAGYREIRPPQ